MEDSGLKRLIEVLNKHETPMSLAAVRRAINTTVLGMSNDENADAVQRFENLANELAQYDSVFMFSEEVLQYLINETLNAEGAK